MKTLTVMLQAAMTEITKNQVLVSLGANESDLEVQRDGNGKVVQLRINLPDSAADSALANVSAIAGVYAGLEDGNVERVVASYSGDALPAASGWSQFARNGKISESIVSGVYTLTSSTPGGNSVGYDKKKVCGLPPTKTIVRRKIKFTLPASPNIVLLNAGFSATSGKKYSRLNFSVFKSAGQNVLQVLRQYASGAVSDLLMEIKPFDLSIFHQIECYSNGSKIFAVVDGVSSLASSVYESAEASENIIRFSHGISNRTGSGGKIEVDYLEVALGNPEPNPPADATETSDEEYADAE